MLNLNHFSFAHCLLILKNHWCNLSVSFQVILTDTNKQIEGQNVTFLIDEGMNFHCHSV